MTHAHLDHTGYLPALIRDGYSGPIITTDPTHDLCRLLLPDSGYLMEADARYANRKGFARHKPARPLYDQRDAGAALRSFAPWKSHVPSPVVDGVTAVFRPSGLILGAATIELDAD